MSRLWEAEDSTGYSRTHNDKIGLIIAGIAGVFVLVVALYLGLLFVAHDLSPDFLHIDTCLDHGGRWDYDRRVCDSARPN